METDSFFCQFFKQLPETVFELMGLPGTQARAYRFDSVEIKKSFRIDGVLVPKEAGLPVIFVEVQFQRRPKFYANLFGKVFWYLEENDPGQEWRAVALFESRAVEPAQLGPYEDLLNSPRVKRIYLDELSLPDDPPLGLAILQLVTVVREQVRPLVTRVMQKAERQFRDSEMEKTVIGLVEELLLRRFAELDREEIRIMFQLHDLRESKVWQEAHQTGLTEGIEKGIKTGRAEGKTMAQAEMVRKCLANGMSAKEIAQLLGLPLAQVRRLIKPKKS